MFLALRYSAMTSILLMETIRCCVNALFSDRLCYVSTSRPHDGLLSLLSHAQGNPGRPTPTGTRYSSSHVTTLLVAMRRKSSTKRYLHRSGIWARRLAASSKSIVIMGLSATSLSTAEMESSSLVASLQMSAHVLVWRQPLDEPD